MSALLPHLKHHNGTGTSTSTTGQKIEKSNQRNAAASVVFGTLLLLMHLSPAAAAEGDTPNTFAGVKFGVGFSYTLDLGSNDRIREADVVDGIVRVSDEENGIARILLELHYFFHTWDSDRRGIGGFMAIQPGKDDIIDAIGFGVLFGFRLNNTLADSWNIGFGVIIDPNARILGDGIVANQPLPGNETAIRFKEKQQAGLLIMTSVTW